MVWGGSGTRAFAVQEIGSVEPIDLQLTMTSGVNVIVIGVPMETVPFGGADQETSPRNGPSKHCGIGRGLLGRIASSLQFVITQVDAISDSRHVNRVQDIP